MVDPEQVQNGGVEVVDVHGFFHGAIAEFVGGAVGGAAFHTAAGEEGGQVVGGVGGGVAEVAGEEHLGVVEKRAAGFIGLGQLVEEAGEVLVIFLLVAGELLDF